MADLGGSDSDRINQAAEQLRDTYLRHQRTAAREAAARDAAALARLEAPERLRSLCKRFATWASLNAVEQDQCVVVYRYGRKMRKIRKDIHFGWAMGSRYVDDTKMENSASLFRLWVDCDGEITMEVSDPANRFLSPEKDGLFHSSGAAVTDDRLRQYGLKGIEASIAHHVAVSGKVWTG